MTATHRGLVRPGCGRREYRRRHASEVCFTKGPEGARCPQRPHHADTGQERAASAIAYHDAVAVAGHADLPWGV